MGSAENAHGSGTLAVATTNLTVKDLARELNMTDVELMAKAKANGILLSTFSRLTPADTDKIRRLIRPTSAVPSARPADKPATTTTQVDAGRPVMRRRAVGDAPAAPAVTTANAPAATQRRHTAGQKRCTSHSRW